MLFFYGKGRLGDDVVEKTQTRTGKLYRASIAFNRMNQNKEIETVWGSGLVNESKVAHQLHLLKKGCPVTFMTRGWIKTFTRKDGTQSTELDLGFIQALEGGVKLPTQEEVNNGQQVQQQQFVQQPATHQQPMAQPNGYQQVPQQQQQFVQQNGGYHGTAQQQVPVQQNQDNGVLPF